MTELKRPGLDRYAYLFLATIISRVCEKYSFNREINDDRLKREKIVVPVDEQGNVDYGFMSAFMKQKEIQILKPTIEKLCIRLIHNDITGGGEFYSSPLETIPIIRYIRHSSRQALD